MVGLPLVLECNRKEISGYAALILFGIQNNSSSTFTPERYQPKVNGDLS